MVAITLASSSVTSSSCSGAVTRLIAHNLPCAWLKRAALYAMHVSNLQTIQRARKIEGTPSLAGVSANVELLAAMIKSQLITSSQAPSQTEPSTMATTGVACVSISRRTARSRVIISKRIAAVGRQFTNIVSCGKNLRAFGGADDHDSDLGRLHLLQRSRDFRNQLLAQAFTFP